VHSRGIKFGIWVGHSICSDTDDVGSSDPLSGTPDFATLDATLLAGMGVDAVKHDNCVDVANTTAAREANYERYMRFGRALNASGRPMLYDVVMQVDDNSWPATTPHYSYGSVWSPETYGQDRIRALAHMWWSLPCNKCVGFLIRVIQIVSQSLARDNDLLQEKTLHLLHNQWMLLAPPALARACALLLCLCNPFSSFDYLSVRSHSDTIFAACNHSSMCSNVRQLDIVLRSCAVPPRATHAYHVHSLGVSMCVNLI
jgi:hypothetical protein